MRFLDLFVKFYEIEKCSGNTGLFAIKLAASNAYSVYKHHFQLIRDFKMTPAFYFANKYYTHSHDSAYVGLQRRFFKEMRKKQEARGEVNTKAVDTLISTSRFPEFSQAEFFKKYVGGLGRFLKYSQRYMIKEIEIKRPKSVKENMQESLLYSVRLYHESLQNLIEGQREVLRDKKFVFDDGRSVDDKMQAFEEYLKNKIPRFRRKKKTNENKENPIKQ